MREVLDELMAWWEAGETVGVGTVVADLPVRAAPARAPRCWSAPTRPRSARCPAAASRARSTTWPARSSGPATPVLQRYGVSDDDAFAVGLTCGGILDVYVEKVSRETFPELGDIAADVREGRPVALVTVIEHPDPAWLGRRVVVRPGDDRGPARAGLRAGRRRRARRRPRPAGQRRTARPSPTAPTASGAARACGSSCGPSRPSRGCWSSAPSTSPPRSPGSGAFLGYHVTVCDARPVFATATRFPEADEVVVDWPHRYLTAEQEAGRVDAPHDHHRADPRPQVRRAAARGGAAPARGGLRRRDGLAAYARGPDGAAARGRAQTDDELAGLLRARSASTWVPARPRRPRSASPPSSSRVAGAAAASGWPPPADGSTRATCRGADASGGGARVGGAGHGLLDGLVDQRLEVETGRRS